MKRTKKTTFYGTQIGNIDERIQTAGPFITDLPRAIFVDILLKLCIKSIISCKCVCKSWHSVISDPEFAKLHLKQGKTCLLIRDVDASRVSRALYLLEPEDGCSLDAGCCGSVKEKCDHCPQLKIKLKGKLKLPLRNAQVMLSQAGDDMSASFGIKNNRKAPPKKKKRKKKNNWKGEQLIELESRWNHSYSIRSSCNGLLCLLGISAYDLVVCNPILGEFIYLPESSNNRKLERCCSIGLGFCPKNNQYKVIRVFICQIEGPATGTWRRVSAMAEIHTLGTDSWRSVDISEFKQGFNCDPVYLDGALHWICRKDNSKCIVSLDLEEERFQFHSIPSLPAQQRMGWTVGVLGGCLCVYNFIACNHIDIWVMKDYGVCNSWTKLFSLDLSKDQWIFTCDHYKLISYLNNGALLMFEHRWKEFIYYDELRGLRFKHVKFLGIESVFEVIAHTPSLISLKDIATAVNIEVLDINSSCGKLRLVEENYPLVFGPWKDKKQSDTSTMWAPPQPPRRSNRLKSAPKYLEDYVGPR